MLEKKRQAQKSAPTGDDVARRAGVSRTAVSYVLNGVSDKHVSEETRSKVLQAVEELGYHAHSTARALSKGHSEEICLIADFPLTPFPTETIVSAAQQSALQYGYSIVVYFCYGLTSEQRRVLLQKIFARRPIGILSGGPAFTAEDAALAHQMGVEHIVLMSLSSQPVTNEHEITLPIIEVGHLAAQHLLERGHRRLALVQPDDPVQHSPFLQRLEGMHSAMDEVADTTLDILPLHLSVASANAVVDSYMTRSRAERPTGIYAFSDEYAVLLLREFSRRGIRVPQDVALVGTDDLPLGEFVWPSLTTIRFDSLSLGQRAVEMLVALHKGKPLPEEFSRPAMPELIQRESS
ncbi:MAG TPA: LacI family DNA-binding transcriptional regulator [Ktedonosporobacter sp.]|nr:LacI family DNA-binding transcriptional regulator [Ktedonosporobacter sp.]